ncbi:MAG: hypothetical protein ACP5NV_02855 [Candidatus Woesearchaeota archaeon]
MEQKITFTKRSIVRNDNSYLVCLPISWCRYMVLKPQDKVTIEWDKRDNSLKLEVEN